MNEIIKQMLATYEIKSVSESLWAWREIIQQVALLGLWRSKFFEKAAFYGDSALRIIYGIDRFSEDLDFSLLQTEPRFSLLDYSQSLKPELLSFGFNVEIESKVKRELTTIQSAFLKTNTYKLMISAGISPELIKQDPRQQVLKIKLEVDLTPPAGFLTEMRYLLQPIPFAVRIFSLPDMFAGKMHAVLCRQWKSRLKGRDWYDLVWFATYHPELRLAHLEQRMRQTGHWTGPEPLTEEAWRKRLKARIESVDIEKIKREVEPFIKNTAVLDVWSKEFFFEVAEKIRVI
jgi:predicted nucleotidyltransferase component of viral defense system